MMTVRTPATPDCSRPIDSRGYVPILFAMAPALFSPPIDEFTFLVELWTDDDLRVERVIAGAQHIRLARAAYDAALGVYADRRIRLRHGTRVIRANNETA
ncbi:hypothetical protein NKI86_31975 [Mesorhizobium sp. M0320]|uniref:hypothetical protein n=1 Tax=Mesorhizobium sp. M0320 TaxID=2956936 RepID=UPI0033352310